MAFLLDFLIIVLGMSLCWLTSAMYQVIHISVEGGEVMRESVLLFDILGHFITAEVKIQNPIDMKFTWSSLVLWLLYVSIFESSRWQATPGKWLLKLQVTDYDGNRLDFPQAFARNFSMVFSDLTFGLGYILAGVTKHKQALHDMITKCLVVRGRAG